MVESNQLGHLIMMIDIGHLLGMAALRWSDAFQIVYFRNSGLLGAFENDVVDGISGCTGLLHAP